MSECLTVARGKTWAPCYFCPPSFYLLNILTQYSLFILEGWISNLHKVVWDLQEHSLYKYALGLSDPTRVRNDRFWDVEKTKTLFWIPCDPYLPQTLHSMKRNHIIGHRVTLTIHMVLSYMKMLLFFFFWWFQKCCLCQVCKTANAEKTSVVFDFIVHWPLGWFFFHWVMGWRLRLRTCYIGHLKHPVVGEEFKTKTKA